MGDMSTNDFRPTFYDDDDVREYMEKLEKENQSLRDLLGEVDTMLELLAKTIGGHIPIERIRDKVREGLKDDAK